MKKIGCCFMLIIVVIASSIVHAEPYKVAMFYPRDAPFWNMFTNFMQEAANDLGIELQLYNGENNHLKMVREVEQALKGSDKPDVILFSNFKYTAVKIISMAEEAKVAAFLVNSPLSPKGAAKMGAPRANYRFWIGEMFPDEEGAGIMLANMLIDEAKTQHKVHTDGKVHMLGFNGPLASGSAITRLAALKKVVKQRTDVELLQIVNIPEWDEKDAQRRLPGLMKRYPQATVAWSGSARLTMGILAGIQQLNLTPGQDLFTECIGFDFSHEIFPRIQAGEVVAASGGHFIEGAWALILVYDYLHGVDFAEQSVSLLTPMGIVTKDNAGIYLRNLTDEKLTPENLTRIDFTQYSKALNPEIQEYQFSLDSVLSQLSLKEERQHKQSTDQ